MTANYVLLEKITVGAAGASSVTFSGIPQTGYTDLVLKISARAVGVDNQLTFNGSTTSDSSRYLFGTGTSTISGSDANNIQLQGTPQTTFTANTFGNMDIYIPNYTSSNSKSLSIDSVTENNAAESYQFFGAGLWANSSAITSITITNSSGNYTQYSTFYLYGVAKLGTTPAIVPYATGGDTIMTDGTYWYHAFLSSGTFTPQKAITCDYLVVAGGAGGGRYKGGGGGAGGLRSTVTATGGGGSLESSLSLASNTSYTVTIGAGGAGGADAGSGAQNGINGSNSVFATITSTGGGGGGGAYAASNSPGSTGGSGGGGNGDALTGGGAGTTNQGFAGAAGASAQGGGGGGAGETGNTDASGEGGDGVATSISGSSVTYAGGGGGGGNSSAKSGGTGGGGTGGYTSGATAGTVNTGGGGGGGAGDSGGATVGAQGGSGIVIVRYAV
jgi:hypothetical protein